MTGGSLQLNQLTGVAYNAEIWDPVTGQWTIGAAATFQAAPVPLQRVADARRVGADRRRRSAGAGEEPQRRDLLSALPLSAERAACSAPVAAFLPRPRSGSDSRSRRPWGPRTRFSRVTFVRAGSSTHSTILEQRFLELPFTQSGQTVTATLPGNANVGCCRATGCCSSGRAVCRRSQISCSCQAEPAPRGAEPSSGSASPSAGLIDAGGGRPPRQCPSR